VTRDLELLRFAVLFTDALPPRRTLSILKTQGLEGLKQAVAGASPDAITRAGETAADLDVREVGVLIYGQDGYPIALTELPSPPPALFYRGSLSLLSEPAVGMCGSRSASEVGLNAAHLSGVAVANAGLTIISGYARGVDMETHLAALAAGGRTIIVLAEGFLHFQIKRAFGGSLDSDRVLVMSQFPPRQTWNVGAAMARNAVIAALGRALVVIEANGGGGTLDAGLQALDLGRPVLALEFESGPTPPGNRILLEKGAIPVTRPSELAQLISRMQDPSGSSHNQLPLVLN
jgi:DNA processing protein